MHLHNGLDKCIHVQVHIEINFSGINFFLDFKIKFFSDFINFRMEFESILPNLGKFVET